MVYIATLCPAVISLVVLYGKNISDKLKCVTIIPTYLINVVINVLVSSATVCALIGGDVRTDSFVSLSFFVKYVAIAVVLAVVIPAVYLVIKKYINVSISIEEYEAKEK